MQRNVVIVSAYLEIIVGAAFAIVPDLPCTLLFAGKPQSIAQPLARWVGVSLFALGMACLPPKQMAPHRRAALGLFIFNTGVAIVLAYFGTTSPVHGFLLWPVVILHAVIAAMLLVPVFTTGGAWSGTVVMDEAIKQRK